MFYIKLEDGTRCEVAGMFDIDGEDTTDPQETFAVTAYHPKGVWISCEVRPEMLENGIRYDA